MHLSPVGTRNISSPVAGALSSTGNLLRQQNRWHVRRYSIFGVEREKREKKEGRIRNKVIMSSAICAILRCKTVQFVPFVDRRYAFLILFSSLIL